MFGLRAAFQPETATANWKCYNESETLNEPATNLAGESLAQIGWSLT